MIQATIQFNTHRPTFNGKRSQWVVTRDFNDEKHIDNFVAYMYRTKGYTLDEIWTKPID